MNAAPPQPPAPSTERPAKPPQPAPNAEHSSEALPTDLPKPSIWALLLVILLFIGALIGLFFLGYVPTKHAQAQAKSDADARSSDLPIVAVEKPLLSQASLDQTYPCDIRANQQTSLYSRATGYIHTFNGLDVQSPVKKGDVLVVIDTPEVDAQLAEAIANVAQGNANIAKANADLTLARLSIDRYHSAEKNDAGSVSQTDIDAKQAAYDQALAALEQAKANVASLNAEVDRLKVLVSFEHIIAPFDGVITARGYDVGSLVYSTTVGNTGSAILDIAQTDKLRAYVSVPQPVATMVKIGQPAFITVRNYPQRQFQGKIARASGALNLATRTETFQIDLDNPDSALQPGMYAQIRFAVTNPRPALLVATSALIFNTQGSQIAIVKDGKINLKKIAVGRDLGTQLEIIDGITPDDQVVTNPGARIAEGAEVQVQLPQPQTADAKK